MTGRLHVTEGSRPARRAWLALCAVAATIVLVGPSGGAAQDQEEDPSRVFDVFYEARLVPSERVLRVSIELDRRARLVHELRLHIDPTRHLSFEGDGQVEVEGEYVTWTPPEDGGRLGYTFRVDHLRDERSYDSRCAKTWAVFKGGDMVPPIRARFSDGARSRSRLRFVLPEGWSVAAPYTRLTGGIYRIEHPHRSLDRPTGWFVLGDLSVTREEIAGTKVAVAGPKRHGIRPFDLIALLNWTLPVLNEIVAEPLDRLLIVSAADPMWRGGLSGVRSLYVHADRPLITNDATSPLLHELVHTVMSARADDRHDWLVEGIAEYYSMQLLVRTGAVSAERMQSRMDRLADAASQDRRGEGKQGTRAGTLFMAELDAAIRERTSGLRSLDDVLKALTASKGALDLERLEEAIRSGTGLDPTEVMPAVPGSGAGEVGSGARRGRTSATRARDQIVQVGVMSSFSIFE